MTAHIIYLCYIGFSAGIEEVLGPLDVNPMCLRFVVDWSDDECKVNSSINFIIGEDINE
jgi:hypothetical protein